MNQPPHINAAVPDSPLNPAEAAALLDATTRQARRKFEPYPAWMLAFRAFLGLAGYGAAWLSVRGQHLAVGIRPPRSSPSWLRSGCSTSARPCSWPGGRPPG